MLFLSGFIMTDHNHVRRGCHYHVRRGYVRLYESWFDSMSRWFDHELPQPRPTWLWLPRPFPPGSSSARRSSSAIHIHGGAGGDYPVCGCEQECATLRTSRVGGGFCKEGLCKKPIPAVPKELRARGRPDKGPSVKKSAKAGVVDQGTWVQ